MAQRFQWHVCFSLLLIVSLLVGCTESEQNLGGKATITGEVEGTNALPEIMQTPEETAKVEEIPLTDIETIAAETPPAQEETPKVEETAPEETTTVEDIPPTNTENAIMTPPPTNQTNVSLCGNNVINPGEQCDGTNFNGATCQSIGYTSGTLSCYSNCTVNVNNCRHNYCGDGIIGYGESCDGTNLGGQTCRNFGFNNGTLSCTNCTFNLALCRNTTTNQTPPAVCGDGIIGPGEVCDGNNLGGKTCQSIGYPNGGVLRCHSSCIAFNITGCLQGTNQTNTTCTNECSPTGIRTCATNTAYRICGNYDADTCLEWGTTTACATGQTCSQGNCTQTTVPASCTDSDGGQNLFVRGTVTARNATGNVSATDTCSGTANVYEYSCASPTSSIVISNVYTCPSGTCTNGACTNTTANLCGNGIINTGETCDGANLGGRNCSSFGGYVGGTLRCASNCTAFNLSACIPADLCGNGVINTGEQCDLGTANNGLCPKTCGTSCRINNCTTAPAQNLKVVGFVVVPTVKRIDMTICKTQNSAVSGSFTYTLTGDYKKSKVAQLPTTLKQCSLGSTTVTGFTYSELFKNTTRGTKHTTTAMAQFPTQYNSLITDDKVESTLTLT